MGVPRSTPYPFRFVQNYTHKKPTHIFILHEGNIHSYRQIFMDGRKHPAELDPTWFGHSIGWWEGDTLVIDTVGFNDKFWFDRQGTPHTEQLHTIERWTRSNLGTLVNDSHHRRPGRVLQAVYGDVQGHAAALPTTRSWSTSARRTISTASPAATKIRSRSSVNGVGSHFSRTLCSKNDSRPHFRKRSRSVGVEQVVCGRGRPGESRVPPAREAARAGTRAVHRSRNAANLGCRCDQARYRGCLTARST